ELMDEVLRVEDDPDLRRLLVKTALERRQFAMARSHLQVLRPWRDVAAAVAAEQASRARGKPLPAELAGEDPRLGELDGYWGQLLEAESGKKPAEAIACYRLAVRRAPRIEGTHARLASVPRRQKEPAPARRLRNVEEADKVIDALVARNAAGPEAYLARWRYRRDFDLLAIRETPRGKID